MSLIDIYNRLYADSIVEPDDLLLVYKKGN